MEKHGLTEAAQPSGLTLIGHAVVTTIRTGAKAGHSSMIRPGTAPRSSSTAARRRWMVLPSLSDPCEPAGSVAIRA